MDPHLDTLGSTCVHNMAVLFSCKYQRALRAHPDPLLRGARFLLLTRGGSRVILNNQHTKSQPKMKQQNEILCVCINSSNYRNKPTTTCIKNKTLFADLIAGISHTAFDDPLLPARIVSIHRPTTGQPPADRRPPDESGGLVTFRRAGSEVEQTRRYAAL